MSFHSIQKFGVDSIIDKLNMMKNSFQPIVEAEESFTFQHLPRQNEGLKINKSPYLQSNLYDLEQQQNQESLRNTTRTVQFFDDIDDFQSRKQKISKIQKKYLSVISNDSEHKRTKLKIFSSKCSKNHSTSQIDKTNISNNKENWLQSKGREVKNILGDLHSAMTQCYAHIPKTEKILEKFDKIAKRS